MKSIRGFALGLALGVAAAIATVGLAQSTKPVEQGQTQKTESMMSCCCHGDSCAMHGKDKEHAKMQMKEHTGEGGCCRQSHRFVCCPV